MSGRRILAAALVPLVLALVAATPEPWPTPPADRVFSLAGTWTCGASDGAQIRRVGTRSGNAIEVTNEVRTRYGETFTAHDRYAFDPSGGVWSIDLDAGSPRAIHAAAPSWLARSWNALGRDGQGTLQRIRFDWIGEGELTRSLQVEDPPGSGRWQTRVSEGCARGDTVPAWAPKNCPMPNIPAHAIEAATPDMRGIPPQTPYGTVVVVVQLDAESRVVSTSIQSSPSPYLNAMAMRAARESRYQTEIRGCKAIAAKYLFLVTIEGR